MHVVLRCPCGANLKADMKFVGREMKCPKCQTKLVVPPPPTAAKSEPEPMELEMLDPMQIPFPPVAPMPTGHVPQAYYPAAAAPTPAAHPVPPRGKKKSKPASKSSRLVFWIVSGAAIVMVAGGIGIYLIWEFTKVSSQGQKSRHQVTLDGRSYDARTLDQAFGPVVQPEMIPPKPNPFDSGRRELRDPQWVGAERDLEMADLIDRVEPSIVRLKVTGADGEAVGSGFFVDREGKIVTNYHVVQAATEVIVGTADGKTTKALGFLLYDPSKDLAIIQVDPQAFDIVPIPIAASVPRRGEEVAAFGAPAGFGFTATKGIISAIRSGEEVSATLSDMAEEDLYSYMGYSVAVNWIQTTAAISGGNSGGPLVNMRGEMVGVNTWQVPRAQNLNFASTLDEVTSAFASRSDQLHDFQTLPQTRTRRRLPIGEE